MINEGKSKYYITEQLSENIGETPEGFLIARNVPVGRTGIQIYKASEVPIEPRDDGLVEIQRDEEEVFHPNAIKSLEGKTFCIDHPDEMVTPDNWKELAHGFIQNVRRGIGEQSDLLIGDLIVTTSKAIELIKAGMREISLGYDASYEQIKKGLGRQKDIIFNHIALVMRGRAGHRCAIGDKECNHCEQCKNKNMEEIEDMKFKKKVLDAITKALDSIKDADEDDEDKKKEMADKKAKDEETAKVEELKAIRDKLAKDEDLSEEEMEKLEKDADTTEEEKAKINDKRMAKDKKAKDKKTGDEEGDEHEECLEKQVEKLTNIVEALVTSTGEAQANFDKKFKDVEAKVEELKALDKKAKDADEEDDEEKEKIEAKDCDTVWPEVAAKADVLAPGIKLVKPTKDHMKSLDIIKREAIKAAYTSDKDTIAPVVKIKTIDKLSGDSLDVVFISAAELIQNRNNIKTKDSVVFKSKEAQSEIQKIQKANNDFWKNKK